MEPQLTAFTDCEDQMTASQRAASIKWCTAPGNNTLHLNGVNQPGLQPGRLEGRLLLVVPQVQLQAGQPAGSVQNALLLDPTD